MTTTVDQMITGWYPTPVGFWRELGESLGLVERLPGRGRHATTRPPVPTNSRNATRIKYGPGGKPARTRVQLDERRANQPKPARGVAKVEPRLRTRNPADRGARANVSGRSLRSSGANGSQGGFAAKIRNQPAELWWHGSGR